MPKGTQRGKEAKKPKQSKKPASPAPSSPAQSKITSPGAGKK